MWFTNFTIQTTCRSPLLLSAQPTLPFERDLELNRTYYYELRKVLFLSYEKLQNLSSERCLGLKLVLMNHQLSAPKIHYGTRIEGWLKKIMQVRMFKQYDATWSEINNRFIWPEKNKFTLKIRASQRNTL